MDSEKASSDFVKATPCFTWHSNRCRVQAAVATVTRASSVSYPACFDCSLMDSITPSRRQGQEPPKIMDATNDPWTFPSKLYPPDPVENGFESSATIDHECSKCSPARL